MAAPTKEELLAELEIAYSDFAGSATKAQISSALAFLTETPEEQEGGVSKTTFPIDALILHDAGGNEIVFDLDTLSIDAKGLQEQYENAIVCTGVGPYMLLDLSQFTLYNDMTLVFRDPPSDKPIVFAFSGGPAAPAATEEDAA